MKKINVIRITTSQALSLIFILFIGCAKDDDERILFNQNFDYGTLTDIEGNKYKTIAIGTQTWMAENLRVTKLNDSTPIPYFEWEWDKIPYYIWVLDDPIACKDTYGAQYNWYAVKSSKLCPTGWHVPNDPEWTILTEYLGGESVAGGKLKEAGTKHWLDPNVGATNESGFTALPTDGIWGMDLGKGCIMWSTTEFNTDFAWYRLLDVKSKEVYRHFDDKTDCYSVRCIKD